MKRILWGGVLAAGIAGVAYLAAVGCCHLMDFRQKPVSLSKELRLTAAQAKAVGALETEFLARKEAACRMLCAKRAQMIQILKQPEPDQGALSVLTEEIGREQVVLEKETLEHLAAVSRLLEPAQREKMVGLMAGRLRSACRMTGCGMTKGCAVTGRGKR